MNIKDNNHKYMWLNRKTVYRTKRLNSENILRENGWNAYVFNVVQLLDGLTVESFIDERDKQCYEATVMDGELLAVERI